MKTKRNYITLIILGLLLVLTNTLGAASTSNWSEPINLSGWQSNLSESWLMKGEEGMQALFWIHYDINPNMDSVQARVRHPSGEWSAAESLFGAVEEYPVYPKFAAAPDGTFWALWALKDKTHPGDDILVVAASWKGSGPWQSEALSDFETTVRNINLSIGPDGHMAATWVACASTAGDHEGPCDVRLRRRDPGANNWKPRDSSVDAAITGVIDGRSLVGPQGLVVTTWAEYSQTTAGHWLVMSSVFDPNANSWSFPPENISEGNIEPGTNNFLSEPVMGADGTVVAGWYQRHPSISAKSELSAVTRSASNGKWSLPVSLSYYHFPSPDNTLQFKLGQDGTAVAAWVEKRGTTINEYAVYANQRDPGGTWRSSQIKISDWIDRIELAVPQVWPDGSCLLLWKAVDHRRDPSEDESVFWSARSPKGTWGNPNQLGAWFSEVFAVSLAAEDGGSVTAVWGIEDTTQPAGQYAGALAASWKPGNGDTPVSTLTSGYHSIYLNSDGVVVSPNGVSRASSWVARKYINNPNPTAVDGIFYTHSFNGAYLPMVVK